MLGAALSAEGTLHNIAFKSSSLPKMKGEKNCPSSPGQKQRDKVYFPATASLKESTFVKTQVSPSFSGHQTELPSEF